MRRRKQLDSQEYAFHGSFGPPFKRGLGGFLVLTISMLYSFTSPAQYAPMGHFQLASPSIEVSKAFFEGSTTISLDLDVEGVELRYSLTGEEVSENSLLYESSIALSNSALIRAKAFHRDYRTSEEVNVRVFRINLREPMGMTYAPDPAPQYTGQGAASLTDFQKGSMNFRDGRWLGFSSDSIVFAVDSKVPVNQLTLSVLEDHGSWIFAPNRVEVWQDLKQVGDWIIEAPNTLSPKSFQFIEVPLKSPTSGTLQVKVIMNKIPDWHDGKGTTPWLFIDEIFISN